MTRMNSATMSSVNSPLSENARPRPRAGIGQHLTSVAAKPTSQWTRLSSSSPPAITMPISQSGASCGLPPARMTRRSSGRSTGSLARRMRRGQAPNGVIRRLRTAQCVRATAEA